MFKTLASELKNGRHVRVLEDETPISFRRFFGLLETSNVFARWFSGTLAAYEAAAFYWELPPLTTATIGHDTEYVLIDAPILAGFTPERAPFAEQFDRVQGEEVVVFRNLGGDALLVVPCPRGPAENYPHLAAFLRGAGKEQVRALWRRTAQEMLRSIGERPVWLSTAGGGVAWLHVRLDSRPKYYSHAPYRNL